MQTERVWAVYLTPVGVRNRSRGRKEKLTVRGKEYLLELPLHADLALIRAAQADTFGNLVYEGTTINFNPLMAMAADLVVADVGSICEIGSFAPEQVGTPGSFCGLCVTGLSDESCVGSLEKEVDLSLS